MNRLDGYINYLDAFDNQDLLSALESLSSNRLEELLDNLKHIDESWEPSQKCSGISAAYLDAAKTFRFGAAGDTRIASSFIDADYIAKLLLYYQNVDVGFPGYRESDIEKEIRAKSGIGPSKLNLMLELQALLSIRPFLDNNLITLVPDVFSLKCNDAYGSSIDNEIPNETKEDMNNAELLSALDEYDPFKGQDTGDGKVGFEFNNNYNDHKYFHPAYDINSDLNVILKTGSEMICTSSNMHDYLSKKYSMLEKELSASGFWSSMYCNSQVFDFNSLSKEDLFKIRANDDSFAIWRASVNKSLNYIRESSKNRVISEKEAKEVLGDEITTASIELKNKISKSSFLSNAKDSVITFGIGTFSAATFNPNPVIAITTGGCTASLTLMYKILFDGVKEDDISCLKLYSVFTGR